MALGLVYKWGYSPMYTVGVITGPTLQRNIRHGNEVDGDGPLNSFTMILGSSATWFVEADGIGRKQRWCLNFLSVEVVLDEDEEADFALMTSMISSNGTSRSQANTCCHSIAPMTRATLDKLTSSSRALQRIVFLHDNEGSGWPRWTSTFVGLKRNAKHIKNKTTWDNWEKTWETLTPGPPYHSDS